MQRLGLYLSIAFIIIFGSAFTMQSRLDDIHRKIIKTYPNLEHVSADEFEAFETDERVVFDIRNEKEFAVSHLQRAIQVDPDMAPEDFLAQYGHLLEEKKAIFYCSVGRRSSAFAARVVNQLEQSSNGNIYNLEGGVFRWHNEERPLRQSERPTYYVHPYNVWAGRLIEEKKSIRYKPDLK